MLGATLKPGESVRYDLAEGRRAYLVPAVGEIEVNGVRVGPRDGAAVTGETALDVRAIGEAEVVLVDSL